MRSFCTVICWYLFLCHAFTQSPTQVLRGTVLDRDTKQPLSGVSIQVELANGQNPQSTSSDSNGTYLFKDVPTGRVRIGAQRTGYKPYISEDIILSSAKELVYTVDMMAQSLSIAETVIKASNNAFEPVNPLNVVSARAVSTEEIDRVAGAINDPARAALSFPGVQKGEDDTENQIVVRGNAPSGILWRLEGIDIPNPNHFALIGSSGGGLTAFSAQLFGPSDFLTGGMPAEYGNTLSGVFDIRFRQGNDERREYRARLGILGLDFSTEGPFRRGRSAYLINYRYSTLGLLNRFGFNLVGERVSNNFQDLSFNLTFKSADQRHRWTVFGVGGMSEEHYFPVENATQRNPAIPNHWEDRLKPANVGILGSTWTYLPDTRSYVKVALAFTGNDIRRASDVLDLNDARRRYESRTFRDGRIIASASYQRKLSERMHLKAGMIFNGIHFNFFQEYMPRFLQVPPQPDEGFASVQGTGTTSQWQQYAQIQWQPAPRWTIQTGYHALWLAVNKRLAFDPRFSVQYRANDRHRLSLAFGLYRKTLPLPTYFVRNAAGEAISRNLPLLQSAHLIGSWNWFLGTGRRLLVEAYVQKSAKVPIAADPTATYWMLNGNDGFPVFPVVSQGRGLNYGLDAGLEQRFRGGLFFLLNGSYYRAMFSLGQKVWLPSRFDNHFATAVTIGRELALGKRDVLQFGARIMYNGGFRYTPHNPTLSAQAGAYVPENQTPFAGQLPPYYRIDARTAWRFNRSRMAGSVSLDIQNILNRANPAQVLYDPVRKDVFTEYRGELIPVLAFQLDF